MKWEASFAILTCPSGKLVPEASNLSGIAQAAKSILDSLYNNRS